MRRMAGSLTLAAGALILLALPLVIGATQNVQNERFTGLMLAALVACIVALVLSSVQDRTPAEIAATDITAKLAPFDLSRQLSSNRTQGIPNMIALVQDTAKRLA